MVILVSPNSSFLKKKQNTLDDGGFYGGKRSEILHCLAQPRVDLDELQKHCLTEGGLLSSDLRRKAWHKLLGVNLCNLEICDKSDGNEINGNSDVEDIIDIDVNRSVYFRYKHIQVEGKHNVHVRDKAKTKLCRVIKTTVNRIGNGLNYYQGFHDVASVVYVNIPNRHLAAAVLHRIAKKYLRDAMQESFDPITSLLDDLFYPLLEKLDPHLHDFLQAHELQATAFLTWIITLFSHDVHNHEIASRLFDSIIASHKLFPLYLSMAVLTHERNRQELFSVECEDPAMLQVIATRLIGNLVHDDEGSEGAFTVQAMIDSAVEYTKIVTPESLLCKKERTERHDIIGHFDNKFNYVFSDWMQWKLQCPDQPSSMNLRAIFSTEDDTYYNSFDTQSTNEKHEISYSPSLLVSETSSDEDDDC